MLMEMKDQRPDEESAMFSKKYVGPANCASCEKNIVNLLGQPVDYHVWKRLPFREPSERIARVSTTFVIMATRSNWDRRKGCTKEWQTLLFSVILCANS